MNSLEPDEVDATIAMLNFDTLGTGDVVGVLGDSDLIGNVLVYGGENSVAVERRFSTPGSSDHAFFQRAGIPTIFFLANDFSRIHSSDDSLEFVDPELMGNSAALALGLLDSLGDP